MSTYVLFLHPVPVCMRFCTFCHLFAPAHNGLLLRKAEQDLTCAQAVLRAFTHETSVYSLIRRTFGESRVCTDVNSGVKYPHERKSNPGCQIASAVF